MSVRDFSLVLSSTRMMLLSSSWNQEIFLLDFIFHIWLYLPQIPHPSSWYSLHRFHWLGHGLVQGPVSLCKVYWAHFPDSPHLPHTQAPLPQFILHAIAKSMVPKYHTHPFNGVIFLFQASLCPTHLLERRGQLIWQWKCLTQPSQLCLVDKISMGIEGKLRLREAKSLVTCLVVVELGLNLCCLNPHTRNQAPHSGRASR